MADECSCGCSSPSRAVFGAVPVRRGADPVDAPAQHGIPQALIPAGTFTMGDSSGDRNPGDGEVPQHRVSLDAFSIDTTSVTNDDFARFVDATGYRTEAEVFGFSAVFHLAVAADEEDLLGRPPQTPWWVGVRGADWRRPGGPLSSIEDLGDHPVVHVISYCNRYRNSARSQNTPDSSMGNAGFRTVGL